MDAQKQQKFHETFWKSNGDYKSQNIMLSGLMQLKVSGGPENVKNKVITYWDYFIQTLKVRDQVCQGFLCNLLKIGKGRFASIQSKLRNNQTMEDERGKHENRTIRLTCELKGMIIDHCLSIPHSESHYRR